MLNRLRNWPEWPLVGMILAVKALVFLYGAVSFQVLADQRLRTLREGFEIWVHWDGANYLDVAENGYQATGDEAAFLVLFPLFPWLTRFLAAVSGSILGGALALNAIASVAVGILLRRLVRLDESDAVADRAVWFLFVFPTSYFLHITYSESLFLALALGCFLSARQGRWGRVGLLGFFAGLARINALVLIPALGLEALAEYRRSRRWHRGFLWVGTVILGVCGYLLVNHAVTGDAFAFLRIQRQHFHRNLTWPWNGMLNAWLSTTWRAPREAHIVGAEELFFSLLGLAASVAAWKTLRISYALWMTANWILFTSYNFIWCVPRYTLLLFPLFILFGRLAARPILSAVLTAWSLLFLGLFAGLFVQGLWAF